MRKIKCAIGVCLTGTGRLLWSKVYFQQFKNFFNVDRHNCELDEIRPLGIVVAR